jgi:N-acetylglucosamine kinase-like BadF-type ATPase
MMMLNQRKKACCNAMGNIFDCGNSGAKVAFGNQHQNVISEKEHILANQCSGLWIGRKMIVASMEIDTLYA